MNTRHGDEDRAADAAGKAALRQQVARELYAQRCAQAKALARRALAPRLTAEKAAALAVPLCGWYAFAGAVLLFQHYFVGPVYTIYK